MRTVLHRASVVRPMAAALLALTLAACATPEPITLPTLATDAAWRQAIAAGERHFGAAATAQPLPDPLQVSPAMRAHLEAHVRPTARAADDLRRPLLDALFERRGLKLDYAADHTRTAAEAFDERRGNCLSLVLMTTALADELGLRVRVREVLGEPSWTRSGQLVLVAGHVNLVLLPPLGGPTFAGQGSGEWVVDFVPGQNQRRQRVREVSMAQVRAMYLNNRAAEAMADGDLPQAFALARAAVTQAPADPNARNTLAVVLHRAGLTDAAEALLREVLARAPDHIGALTNLQGLLVARDAAAEAAALGQRLARLLPEPPYRYYDQARTALAERHWADARALLLRELTRTPEDPLVHHALAEAELGLGDLASARRHLALASSYSSDAAQRQRFHAKLDALRAL